MYLRREGIIPLRETKASQTTNCASLGYPCTFETGSWASDGGTCTLYLDKYWKGQQQMENGISSTQITQEAMLLPLSLLENFKIKDQSLDS